MRHSDPSLQITVTPAPPPFLVRPTGVRYFVLAAGCSLAVLTYVHRLGFAVGASDIKKDLGLDSAQWGYLWAAFLVAYGLFQVPGGLLGDRFGGRHLLTILVLTWSLLTGAIALTFFLPSRGWLPFTFLLVLRFLFGMVQAGGFPALARVLADWMPTRERGFAQGMVWTFSRLGGALVPFLFLWLFWVFGGWAAPLALMAGLGILWCAVFWPWFRNRPEEMNQVNVAERALIESGRSAALPRPPPLPLSRYLGSRNVWALCLMYGFVGFPGNFFTSLLADYLQDHRKLSKETTAWLTSMPLAFGIVSCLVGGVLSDWIIRHWGSRRWGRRIPGMVGLALAALTCLGSIWAQEVWLLGLLFSATFFFNDSIMGPAWASCADVGERHAGALSGAMNMTGAFFGAAGMSFAGALFEKKWYVPVFVVFACSYVLASLCWLAVDVTKPLAPKE
jgi:MFS transporter, ACS family, glucarate transporter